MKLLRALIFGSLLTLAQSCSVATQPQLEFLAESQVQAPPLTVNFEIKSYCSPGYSPSQFSDFFVSNRSAQLHLGLLTGDLDADGLVDKLELQVAPRFGFQIGSAQSISSYFGDLVVFSAGVYPVDQNRLRCTGPDDRTDNDRDGLLLCEERILQTDPNNFDTDGDGVPDSVELRCGMNPRDPADAALDTDSDGITNLQECKLNTPIDFSNLAPSVAQVAYRYRTERITSPSPCMRFFVENVPILPEAGINHVSVIFTERNAITGQKQMTPFEALVNPDIAGSPGATINCTVAPDAGGSPQGSCVTQ